MTIYFCKHFAIFQFYFWTFFFYFLLCNNFSVKFKRKKENKNVMS